MEKITIIGLGLIGGSLGLALKRANLKNVEIVGHDRNAETAGLAQKRGAVDRTEWNLLTSVQGASLVIIATPVLAVKEILGLIADHLPAGALVTDTASTKAQILEWAKELLPNSVNFVGGHPMAGKEVPGIEGSAASLFEGAIYCLVPALNASQSAIDSMVGLVQTIGATPFFVDAHEHDGFAAGISHLPLVISAALATVVSRSPSWREMARLAASGFRDVSRLASGSEEMSRDICLTNRESIVHWIDRFIAEMERYRDLVQGDSEGITKAFAEARAIRERWLALKAGKLSEETAIDIPSGREAMTRMFLGGGVTRRLFGDEEPRGRSKH